MRTHKIVLSSLAYKGIDIRVCKNLINGTDLWRAGGRPSNKTLGNWKKLELTRDLTILVAHEYKLRPYEVFSTILEGEDKGVYLHPSVALYYAKYLDIELYNYLVTQLGNYSLTNNQEKLKWLTLRDYHKIAFSELSSTMKELGITDYATPNRIIQLAISSIPKPLDSYNTDELERRIELERLVKKELLIKKPQGDADIVRCVRELVH